MANRQQFKMLHISTSVALLLSELKIAENQLRDLHYYKTWSYVKKVTGCAKNAQQLFIELVQSLQKSIRWIEQGEVAALNKHLVNNYI